MLVLIPDMKFIKSGDTKATDLVIKIFIVSNIFLVGSALLVTLFS